MSTLYAGGLIFDGDGTLLEEHGLLVEGDRIKRVAPMGEFEGFADLRVDTAGGTLLPGLYDCHVHLCFDGAADPFAAMVKESDSSLTMRALGNAQANLRGGVTSIRDCGGKDYIEFAVRDSCNKRFFQGPSIRAAGRMICMTGGHGNRWGRVADGCDEVVKAVREQIHAGSDFIKIMATGGVMTPGVNPEDAHYSAEEMAAGIGEAQRFHKHTASHAQGRDGILNAVRGGIDSIEHGIFMDDRCCEEMKETGTYLVPTIAALKNILLHADKGIPDYAVEKARNVAEHHRRSIKLFYEAGGLIAMGTDAGTPFNKHGENARELEYMVEYGLEPKDALIAATANAADLVRENQRGRIREGSFADLLVVDGNPIDDIAMVAHRENHRLVVKNGELVAGSPGNGKLPR
ncbi:MAG: amidohydrolase family protein [Gammaproteobacteria bacterium]|nr:amidohydrolase family protein [Gammaproteobacteria bacterium]